MFRNKTPDVRPTVKYIATFPSQHLEPRNIMTNHWHLLQEDPTVRKYIGYRPEMVFRRARSLQDKLVSICYTGTFNSPRLPKGIHRFSKCTCCPLISPSTNFILPNGERFTPNFFANCATQCIVFLMLCKCRAFYVSQTARQFKLKINDHIYYLAKRKMLTPVSCHLDLYHKFDTSFV